MWKSDVVAQQQRALVLKSSELLKHIAEAPTLRMGWVDCCLSRLGVSIDGSFLHILGGSLISCREVPRASSYNPSFSCLHDLKMIMVPAGVSHYPRW